MLAKDGHRLLLISRYGLDNVPYNTPREDTAWSECSLRRWLNNTFLNEAFTHEEQQYIIYLRITADTNPYSKYRDTWQGSEITDKVFLLSAKEARTYFKYDADRTCQATDYAKHAGSNKAYTDNNGNCWWWLHTSGSDSDYTTNVKWTGEVDYSGNCVDHAYGPFDPLSG